MSNLWAYRADVLADQLIVGYAVEATDGHIGKIDATSDQVDNAHLVVDTGFWIFGKKRVIPAGVVKQIDVENETVYISMTKDEVKQAPDWRDEWWSNDETRSSYGDYYAPFGW